MVEVRRPPRNACKPDQQQQQPSSSTAPATDTWPANDSDEKEDKPATTSSTNSSTAPVSASKSKLNKQGCQLVKLLCLLFLTSCNRVRQKF